MHDDDKPVTKRELIQILDERDRKLEDRLDHKLDEKFKKFEKRLDRKLDRALDKKLDQKLDEKLAAMFERNNAVLFGQFVRYFDKRLDEELSPLRQAFAHMQDNLDDFLKRMSDDEVERGAMYVQLDRHETWIGELAEHTGTQLSSV